MFRILSLDVATGSCVMAWFVGDYIKSSTSVTAFCVLGMTVWLIYTLDHLIDAKKIKQKAHTQRHLFHQHYFNLLSFFWILVFILNAWLTLFYLEYIILISGFWVLGLTALHFLIGLVEQIRNAIFFQKEIRIAFVYAIGVSLPAFSLCIFCSTVIHYVFVFQIFLLALLNLWIISLFEYESDTLDEQVSLARILGKNALSTYLNYIFVFAFCLNGWLLCNQNITLHQVIILLMNLTLFIIIYKNKLFAINELYRVWIDSIFFYPFLILLFELFLQITH